MSDSDTPAAPAPSEEEVTSPPPAPVSTVADAPANVSQPIPRARQIVNIDEEGESFELNEEALNDIFSRVPENTKVAIYSVVGAFRTGKSFVLDLFLRYLRHNPDGHMLGRGDDIADSGLAKWKEWVLAGVDNKEDARLEGNSNEEQKNGEKGFSWRAGRKRNTTGIWMWETPFYRRNKSGEEIAIFLVDTQGMFDSETTQMLTASIFGLSTLLSSYQIYNVDKRVQEDNLQHLALFTEYGRMALFGKSGSADDKFPTLDKMMSSSEDKETNEKDETDGEENEESLPRPFQRLDFLVRDWQDFSRKQSLDSKRQDMKEYMQELLGERTQQDLSATREQISSCFDKVDCFLLPHPGHEVTEREYDGSVDAIDDRFMELLTNYLDELFAPENLQPKKIHGSTVNARELQTYIKTYAAIFRDASNFPEAKTLLEATAEANNINSKDKAMIRYEREMDTMAGRGCHFVSPKELEEHHHACFEAAMSIFDANARMGRHNQILKFRNELENDLEKSHQKYLEVNAERDPYKNLEFYVVPGALALGLLIFRIVQDLFCYESIGIDVPMYDCKHVSSTLSHLYWAIVVFMLLVTFSTGQVFIGRIKTVVNVLKAAANASSGEKQKTE